MIKKTLLALLAVILGLVMLPTIASAKPACHANDWSGIVLCVSVTSNGSVQKARVFQDGEDAFGVFNVGISQTDNDCKKDRNGYRPIRTNCKTASGKVGGDFITPFSSYSYPRKAFCGVKTMTSSGCGGRALAEGLEYVVGFDSEQGAFGAHTAPGGNIAESHGCVRLPQSVSKFIYTAYANGATVRLVVLDNR